MRPVTSQSLLVIREFFTEGYRAGSYRALLITIILLIILFVIGLAGNAAINFTWTGLTGRDIKVSKISNNFEGYYQGVLGMYRLSHNQREPGQDTEDGIQWTVHCSPPGQD